MTHLNRTFFTHPPDDIKHFVTVPKEYQELIDFTRKKWEIDGQVPGALTVVKHMGSFNFPSASMGTSVRVMYHSGQISMYQGLPFDDSGVEHQSRFTLNHNQGGILNTDQTKKTRISIRSRKNGVRYLYILDFGYLAFNHKAVKTN